MVSSVLLCWITIHVLSSELEKRPEEVKDTVFLNVLYFKKVNHLKKKGKVCKSWCPTCHVTIDELGGYRAAAIHIDVIMSWSVTSVFVRLAWLLIYGCDRQHVEFIKGWVTSLTPHFTASQTQLMAAYSYGRWLLGSHCRSNYSRRCSMTAHIYRHVHSGWESTWETWRERHKDRREE